MSSLLRSYDKIPYTLQGMTKKVTNILKDIKLSQKVKETRSLYITYQLKPGDRLEDIANKLYGNPEHYWILYLVNSLVDPYHDLPYPQQALQEDFLTSYGQTTNFQVTLAPGQSISVGDVIYSNTDVFRNNELIGTGVSTATVTAVKTKNSSVVYVSCDKPPEFGFQKGKIIHRDEVVNGVTVSLNLGTVYYWQLISDPILYYKDADGYKIPTDPQLREGLISIEGQYYNVTLTGSTGNNTFYQGESLYRASDNAFVGYVKEYSTENGVLYVDTFTSSSIAVSDVLRGSISHAEASVGSIISQTRTKYITFQNEIETPFEIPEPVSVASDSVGSVSYYYMDDQALVVDVLPGSTINVGDTLTGDTSGAVGTVSSIEDSQIPSLTVGTVPVYASEYVEQNNDEKRTINLLKPEYFDLIVKELSKLQ